MRIDSNLCRKDLTVHWSAPNSLIRSYLQPCTNSMWGDESEAVAPIIWLYQIVDAQKEKVFFPELLITLRSYEAFFLFWFEFYWFVFPIIQPKMIPPLVQVMVYNALRAICAYGKQGLSNSHWRMRRQALTSNNWGRVAHICVSKLCQYWFRQWLVA